jgi:membrane-associated phospholipid phosphatase
MVTIGRDETDPINGTRPVAGLRRRWLGVLAGALGGFAGLLAVVRRNRTAAFDLAVSVKLQRRHSPALNDLMRLVSWPGFPPQSRIIPPAVVAAWWLGGYRRAAAFQATAWLTGLLSTVVKAFVRRDRPIPPQVRVIVAPLGGTSFPSGHVLTYVGFYGFLAHLVSVHVRGTVARRLSVGALGALIALVGPSRVQQGHHWATDVLASYLLGTAWVLALVALYDRRVDRVARGPE